VTSIRDGSRGSRRGSLDRGGRDRLDEPAGRGYENRTSGLLEVGREGSNKPRVVEDECPCIDAGGRPRLGCPGLRPAAALPPPHRRRRWSRTSRPPTWIPWATADVLRDAADSGAAVLYSTRDEPVAAVAHGGQPAS
jgi:hypothetical protein